MIVDVLASLQEARKEARDELLRTAVAYVEKRASYWDELMRGAVKTHNSNQHPQVFQYMDRRDCYVEVVDYLRGLERIT